MAFRSSYRKIVKLERAWLTAEGPRLPKGGRKTSAVKKGLSFERKAQRRIADYNLPGTQYNNQWIAFRDANGSGWAQPDTYIVMADCILLFEMKLTQGEYAIDQMRKLYKPLLENIYGLPVLSLQVVKGLRDATYLVSHPAELLVSRSPLVHTLHIIK